MAKQIETQQDRQVHRSPAYPSVPLPEAIERALILWKNYTKNSVPRDVLLKKLGYNSPTGPGGRLISALKQFGLATETDGGVRISELGMDLATMPESTNAYQEALRTALYSPKIYQEILNKFGEAPPDRSLLGAELVRVRDFNPKKVDRFIDNFTASVDFVGSKCGVSLDQQGSREHESSTRRDSQSYILEHDDEVGSMIETDGPSYRDSFEFRLGRKKVATLLIDGEPLVKKDFERLRKHLDLLEEMMFCDEASPDFLDLGD